MPRKTELTVEGTVIQVLPHTMFRVTLANGHTVLSHLSGKMRTHSIRLTTGDHVDLVLSMPDLTKGRIIYRHRR